MTEPDPGEEPVEAEPSAEPVEARPMSKTPMFTAKHAARYERQELIRAIDRDQKTHLVCYVGGNRTEVDRDDLFGFVDLLHNIKAGEPIDLLLHTCGGDVDACEKLVNLLHAKVGDAPLRVVIPDMAKSSGTIIALGASTLIMSDSSELGMIDPQFPMKDNQGNVVWHSVSGYLAAFELYSGALSGGNKDQVALLMLDNFDGKIVAKFRGIVERVRRFTERILNKRGLNATKIVSELLDSNVWRTHAQPIGHGDAADIGLIVEYYPPEDERWQAYWKLYCLQRIEVGKKKKLFESTWVSQIVRP